MKHLLKNIKASNCKIIAQFKVGNSSYNLSSFGKESSISLDGHDILSCITGSQDNTKVSNLICDLILNGVAEKKIASIQAYLSKDDKVSESIIGNIKKRSDAPLKIITQSKEIPTNVPVKVNFDEAFSPDILIGKLNDFSQAIHDINETLKVCREDILSLSSSKLVKSMWGAKSTQVVMDNLFSNVDENEDWEKSEFYTNIILKSINRLIHKINATLFNVCDEDKKVVGTVLIPNILENFEKIKQIISKVLLMLSNFVYIDEVFKKNTSFPANWFINGTIFEDLKLDYKNLMLFTLKIPRYEQEVIYPLDIMRHSFINKE